jgi:hypothetical protein
VFGLIKFSLFVFIAALTGLAATSIPFGGKTVSARLGDWWNTPAVQSAVVDAQNRVQRGVEAARQGPKEVHDAKSKAEVDRIVARRTTPGTQGRTEPPPRGK